MASLQSTLNVQAFRFPFRFHDMKSNSNNRESGDSEGESASMKLFHFFSSWVLLSRQFFLLAFHSMRAVAASSLLA